MAGVFVVCIVLAVAWYVTVFFFMGIVSSRIGHVAVLSAPVPALGAIGFFASRRCSSVVRAIVTTVCALLLPFLAIYAAIYAHTIYTAASGNFH